MISFFSTEKGEFQSSRTRRNSWGISSTSKVTSLYQSFQIVIYAEASHYLHVGASVIV